MESFLRKNRLLFSLLLLAIFILILGLVSRGVGTAWDETIYFKYSDDLISWAKMGFPRDAESIRLAWNALPFYNPHPPFMKVLSAITANFIGGTYPMPYRWGHIIFASGGLALMFWLLSLEFTLIESLAGTLFVFLQPRLFGEFLIATTDGPVGIGWILLSLLAWQISRQPRKGLWPLLYFIHAAISATKITGFIAIAPIGLYFLARKDWKNLARTCGSVGIAALFVLVLAPYGWHQPLQTLSDYFLYFLHRMVTVKDVPIIYFGEIFGERPPWHYFFVMTAITLPPVVLVGLAFSPLAFNVKKYRALGLALLPGVLCWMVIGATPFAPKHGGVRQFVAFFPYLGLLTWLSALLLRDELQKKLKIKWDYIVFLALLLPSAVGIAAAYPYELSYYNSFIGGLRGAESAGLEISYYLEAINPETLEWLNKNLKTGAHLFILPQWPELLLAYQRHGLLKSDIIIVPQRHEKEADMFLIVRSKFIIDDNLYMARPALFEQKLEGVSLLKVAPAK